MLPPELLGAGLSIQAGIQVNQTAEKSLQLVWFEQVELLRTAERAVCAPKVLLSNVRKEHL